MTNPDKMILMPYALTENNEVVILEYVFKYSDGFHGAVGEIIRPVFEDEYNDAFDDENLEEHYKDVWREDAGSSNGTTLGLSDWVEEHREDLENSTFDEYDVYDLDLSFFELDEEPACWESIACGRIFPITDTIKAKPTNFDELDQLIKEYEN